MEDLATTSAIVGILASVTYVVAFVRIFRRTGHSWLTAILTGLAPLYPLLLTAGIYIGIIGFSEFQVLNLAGLMVPPLLMLWLAFKTWPKAPDKDIFS